MQNFPWAIAVRIGVASFGIALIGPLFSSYVPVFLDGMGLDATGVGFWSGLDAYGSLLILPAITALSDRTRTRLGKRQPFILVGAPLCALAVIALPRMTTLPGLLLAMVGTVVGVALCRGPNASLLADSYPSIMRSRASGVINLMAGVSWVVAFGAGGALYRIDRALPFTLFGITLLVCVGFMLLTVREKKQPEPTPAAAETQMALNDPRLGAALRRLVRGPDRSLLYILLSSFCLVMALLAVANFFTLYAGNVLGVDPGSAAQLLGLFALSGVLASVPLGLLSNRLGRRSTAAWGFVVLLVLFVIAYFTTNVAVIGAILFIAGIASTPGSVNLIPMTLDAAPTGDVGTYVGLTYIFGAAGGIVGPLLAGLLINATGDYRSLFLFGPLAMLAGLAFILLARSGEARGD